MSQQNKDILSYNLKPSQVFEVMELADSIKDSLMIWGSPGIGKSEMARQYADKKYPLLKNQIHKLQNLQYLVADENSDYSQSDYDQFVSTLLDQETNFIDFRLSQIEPSDLRGIPIPVKLYTDQNGIRILESELSKHPNYKTETAVVWASPEVLKLNKDWKGVIIFDEINSAMPIVQAASYQLILDRRVGEMVLPDSAFILAAGNREIDGGVTFPLAVPLRDRMTHIEMVADYQDWIDNYAIPNRLDPATVAFISNTGSKNFNTLNPNDPSHAAGSSPRSWTRIAQMEPARRRQNTSDAVYKAYVAGRVGNDIAIEYTTFVKNIADLPDVMDVLNGTITDLSTCNMDISKNYFIALNLVYKIIDLFDKKLQKTITVEEWSTYCTNWVQFLEFNFSRTQVELLILSMRTTSSAEVVITYDEVPAFHQFTKKYGPMVRKIRRMS